MCHPRHFPALIHWSRMLSRSRTLALVLAATAAVLQSTAALAQQRADSATIAVTSNLVVEGVPAIPAVLAAEVRRYTESRSASLADWHPVRREILISTRFGNTPQLHKVTSPLGARS